MSPPFPLPPFPCPLSLAPLPLPRARVRGVITWRNGTVSGTRREWPGAVELDVSVDGTPAGSAPVRALAYPALTGCPRPGDRVLINTTALDLGLGTGGYALVIAVPDRLPPDPELAGHLVKARYSPLQATVLGADEQGSPHHDVLRDADDIGGMPVVVADLHSALPAVLAGVFSEAERSGVTRSAAGGVPRVVYVMQDGGALPAWFSRTCATLRRGRMAGGDRDHRAVVRRGPGNRDGAHRAARGPARARRRHRGGRAGAGQPRHRDPLGLLRRGGG